MKMYRDAGAEKAADTEIAAECAKYGVHVTSPWDLVGDNAWKAHDPALLEALSFHLDRDYAPMTTKGLILALGKQEAKPFVFDRMIAILLRERADSLGQTAATAILRMLEPKDASVVEAIIKNSSLTGIWSFFIKSYSKLFKSKSIPALRRFLDESDHSTIVEAARALATLGDFQSREKLLQLTQHPDSYVRQPVRQALKRLDAKFEKLGTAGRQH